MDKEYEIFEENLYKLSKVEFIENRIDGVAFFLVSYSLSNSYGIFHEENFIHLEVIHSFKKNFLNNATKKEIICWYDISI